jgi:hypothetical protein
MSIDARIVRNFLNREECRAQEIIDKVAAHGKRYNDAVDRLVEIAEVREALDRLLLQRMERKRR